jgi:hypothetical protein
MLRSLVTATAAAALLAIGATAANAGPSAHAARSCTAPNYPGQGYFTRLSVAHVSCATGRRVTLAHYRCRVKHGRKGRCPSVLGYRCSEVRNSIATEYTSRTTCKRGVRRVVFYYQQNLD